MSASLIMFCGLAVTSGQAPVLPTSIAPPDPTITAPSNPAPATNVVPSSIAPPSVPSPTAVEPTATPNAPGQPAATPYDPNKPVLLRSRTAIIDIDYDKQTRKSIQKVLLYVSRDQGQTWGLESTATPEQESFTFVAKEDGVYWCKIQTVFTNGQKLPPDVTRSPADQKLFMDGTPPLVRILSAKRAGEEIAVEWNVEDKYADDAATMVRYKSNESADSPWVNVPLTQVGRKSVAFKPTTIGPITVEVIGKDMVGNASNAQSEVGTVVAASGLSAQPPVRPISNSDPIIVPGAVGNVPPPSVPAPAGGMTVPPLATPPAATPVAAVPGSPASATPAAPTVAVDPVPVAVTTTDAAVPVPAIKPINLTRFDLAYSLTAGPAGVNGIDLWVTRDDGKSWRKWSRHDGKDSVIKVVLDTRDNSQVEGPYGFRLIPESGSRISDAAPTAGTAPEFRVVVDITAPQVQVFEPVAHPERPDVVVLRWKATDANFGKDPISIEWAESQAGPWRAVNGGDVLPVVGGVAPAAPRMANTGEFGWRLPSELTAPKVFLKFTASDLAGNKTEAMTKDPILVDLTRPRASIRGIVGMTNKP
ncbi:MAG: hypothetical protein U0798_05095 [Gemmataceae bacterium]